MSDCFQQAHLGCGKVLPAQNYSCYRLLRSLRVPLCNAQSTGSVSASMWAGVACNAVVLELVVRAFVAYTTIARKLEVGTRLADAAISF